MKQIDLKTLLIIILAGVLGYFLLFNGTGCNTTDGPDKSQVVIDSLRNSSKIEKLRNDSLMIATEYKDSIILAKEEVIRKDSVALAENEEKIKDLEKRKNEISNTVNAMSDDDVTNGISDYIRTHR